jgi:hypothetical protein
MSIIHTSYIHTSYMGMTQFPLKAAVVGKLYRSALSVTTDYTCSKTLLRIVSKCDSFNLILIFYESKSHFAIKAGNPVKL